MRHFQLCACCGAFPGLLTSLQELELHGCPDPDFFEGMAEAGSSLPSLSFLNEELDSRVSQGIASLSALCSLDIYAYSQDLGPLSSLKQLTDLVILSYMEEVVADVEVHGLLEGVAGMQRLSYLRLPCAPVDVIVALPRTLETIRFGVASFSDIIRIASRDGLPALQSIETIWLQFGIRDTSDAHKAGAVLSSRWKPGVRDAAVLFKHVCAVPCLEAFLCIYSYVPSRLYFATLSTSDVAFKSWGKLGACGVRLGGRCLYLLTESLIFLAKHMGGVID